MNYTPQTDEKERQSNRCDPKTHAHYGWKFARKLEQRCMGLTNLIETQALENKGLLKLTELLDEHPDGYDGPCFCKMCQSYSN